MSKSKQKLAVLVSGSGTLLDAIVGAGVEVELVIADRVCLGFKKAKKYNIHHKLIERSDFTKSFDRDAYTKQVVAELKKHGVTLICMAGWMTLLSKEVFDEFGCRITNNHPALLPAFKGAHAVRDALDYGVKITGCTIHIATLELDEGLILAQETVKVLPDDTEETLHERIKIVERELLPKVLKELMST